MDSFERYRHPVWSIGNINGIDVILAWNEDTKKFSIAVKDLGVAREIGNVGFVADFTPAMSTAFKTALVRTADPNYIKNTEANFADREKVACKQAADAEKLRLEATSVKAIIPMIDNEDFGDSSNAATKTIDIPVQYIGKDRQFSEVGVGDVDFYTDELGEDPKRRRVFDIVYPNDGLSNVEADSRKRLRYFIDKGLYQGKDFPQNVAIYEQGHGRNAILSKRARRLAEYSRPFVAGVQALGREFQDAVRGRAAELAGSNARVGDFQRMVPPSRRRDFGIA